MIKKKIVETFIEEWGMQGIAACLAHKIADRINEEICPPGTLKCYHEVDFQTKKTAHEEYQAMGFERKIKGIFKKICQRRNMDPTEKEIEEFFYEYKYEIENLVSEKIKDIIQNIINH